ncbi:hypothetical protein CLOM_g15655 [Closterium sp. NIES-68]|nr:hypothetical protein CLOM_g15655 [Closterium sp. NIES-68]GJP79364.1 hypothetical protein CLOP_g9606 [Closterium sp. NIES-67]
MALTIPATSIGHHQSLDGDRMPILESSQQTLIVRTDPPFVRWMKEQQAADVTRRHDATGDAGDDDDDDDETYNESESDEYEMAELAAAAAAGGAGKAGREDSDSEREAAAVTATGGGAAAAGKRGMTGKTRNRKWSNAEMLELAAAVLYCRESGSVTRRVGAKGSGYWREIRRVIRRGNPAWSRLSEAMKQQWKRMKARYDDDRMRGQREQGEQGGQGGSYNAVGLLYGNASEGKEKRMAGGDLEWYEYVRQYYMLEGVKDSNGATGNGADATAAATAGRSARADRAARAATANTAAAAVRPSEMPAYAFPESMAPPSWPDAAATAATAGSSLLPLPAPAPSALYPFAAGGSDSYLLSLHSRGVTPATGAAVSQPTNPQLTFLQPALFQPSLFQPAVHMLRGMAPGGSTLTGRKDQKDQRERKERKERKAARRAAERLRGGGGGARVLPGGARVLPGGVKGPLAAAVGERVSAAMGEAVRNACVQFEELTRELLENACAQFEELSQELAEKACAQLEEILAEAMAPGAGGGKRQRR